MEAPIALRFFNTQLKIEIATLAKFYFLTIYFNNEYNFLLSFCNIPNFKNNRQSFMKDNMVLKTKGS